MNNEYKYTGDTLRPNIAQKLIQELFAGQTVHKQEMMDVVPRHHSERGGLPSIARRNNPVTLALWNMKKDGLVQDLGSDNWLIHSTAQEDNKADSEGNNLDHEKLEPERTIGSGKQSVYIYYYPAYQRLAELQDQKVWACKIGKSINDPVSRVVSQTRTALPEYPKIGLVIKTDDLNLLEKAIHNTQLT